MGTKQKPNYVTLRQRWGVGPQVSSLRVPWILPPPILPTLESMPSWVNAWGNVDRSACLGLWVSQLRRLYGCISSRSYRDPDTGRRWRTRPFPTEHAARTYSGRVSTAEVLLTAGHLEELLGRRPEREYPGDYRTQRCPAMRDPGWQGPPEGAPHPSNPRRLGWKGFRCRVFAGRPLEARDQGLSPNPNASLGRGKVLGVAADWRARIRVEKWQMRRFLPSYYMVCPGGDAGVQDPTDPQCARLSTVPRGVRRGGECFQRVLCLVLVLCTAQEAADAAQALAWIRRLPQNPGPATNLRWEEVVAVANRLISRYGLIFAPRRLLCGKCLRVHYGGDPEKRRQSASRRRAAIRLRRQGR